MIASIRRIAGNAASIFINTVVNRATTFVLYALIARHLGAHEFGQLSLALTLFYTFQVFAAAGLSTLITREVAKDRTKTDQYLVNGSMVVIVSSLLSITALLLFVWLMNYSLDTGAVILLMSLGLLPYALSAICEAVFQAWEMMHYIAYANMSVNIAKVGLGFLALASGYGLYGLVLLLVASHVTVLGIEWWLTLRHIARPGWKIDPRFSLEHRVERLSDDVPEVRLRSAESEMDLGARHRAADCDCPADRGRSVFSGRLGAAAPVW